jgi:hypothetical protein
MNGKNVMYLWNGICIENNISCGNKVMFVNRNNLSSQARIKQSLAQAKIIKLHCALMCPTCSYFIILLCLMPDNFTHQGEN